jgi:hypothetical protein
MVGFLGDVYYFVVAQSYTNCLGCVRFPKYCLLVLAGMPISLSIVKLELAQEETRRRKLKTKLCISLNEFL